MTSTKDPVFINLKALLNPTPYVRRLFLTTLLPVLYLDIELLVLINLKCGYIELGNLRVSSEDDTHI